MSELFEQLKPHLDKINAYSSALTLFSWYSIEYGGWQCDGDFLSWNYSVTAGSRLVADIAKQFLSWGDTYTLDISDPGDEIMALMLVIAIDAVNCSQNNN